MCDVKLRSEDLVGVFVGGVHGSEMMGEFKGFCFLVEEARWFGEI
jgi:hypothetical protein